MFLSTFLLPRSANRLAILATLRATLLLVRLATVNPEPAAECTVDPSSSSPLSTDASGSSQLRSGLRPSLPATLLDPEGAMGGEMYVRLGRARMVLEVSAAPKPWLESWVGGVQQGMYQTLQKHTSCKQS